jgi:hypothetical protein
MLKVAASVRLKRTLVQPKEHCKSASPRFRSAKDISQTLA